MIINYGSAAYFIPFIVTAAVVVALFFALRRCSARVKTAAVFVLALINILQHVLKQFIYPHYFGNPYPDLINTAYNMCATLIIITPFVLLSKSRALKQFLSYVGTVAGVITMIVPHWYIGQTFFQWDVLRYYLCHGLLVATSLLPSLWGLYKFFWRDFWKLPFIFFGLLILIAFNDLVFYTVGLMGDWSAGNFFSILYDINPCWMMHPNEGFAWLVPVIDFFTPDIFMGDAATGRPYTPILWYAVPLILLFWVLGFVLGALLDRKNFVSDMRALGSFVRDATAQSVCPRGLSLKVKYKKARFSLKRIRRGKKR